MTESDARPPIFPRSLLDARRKADAAWQAERSAWNAIESNTHPTREQMLPWYDLWVAAYDAQAEFDQSVEQWSRDAKLP